MACKVPPCRRLERSINAPGIGWYRWRERYMGGESDTGITTVVSLETQKDKVMETQFPSIASTSIRQPPKRTPVT